MQAASINIQLSFHFSLWQHELYIPSTIIATAFYRQNDHAKGATCIHNLGNKRGFALWTLSSLRYEYLAPIYQAAGWIPGISGYGEENIPKFPAKNWTGCPVCSQSLYYQKYWNSSLSEFNRRRKLASYIALITLVLLLKPKRARAEFFTVCQNRKTGTESWTKN